MIAVAHIAEAHRARLFLQFPIAIGGAGQAIKGMVGDTQLHDTAPQLLQPLGLGAHHHAIGNGRGAGGGIPDAALDLDQAQAAGTEALDAFGGAKLGDTHTVCLTRWDGN